MATLITGSFLTGKLSELAMKQQRCASACSCNALSAMFACATVTIGHKVASVNRPPLPCSSTRVAEG